jgi:hypothetical protein
MTINYETVRIFFHSTGERVNNSLEKLLSIYLFIHIYIWDYLLQTDSTKCVPITWGRKQIQLPKRSVLGLECQTMDKVQETSTRNAKYTSNTPLSEPVTNIFSSVKPCQCWVRNQHFRDIPRVHHQGRCGEWPYVTHTHTHTHTQTHTHTHTHMPGSYMNVNVHSDEIRTFPKRDFCYFANRYISVSETTTNRKRMGL